MSPCCSCGDTNYAQRRQCFRPATCPQRMLQTAGRPWLMPGKGRVRLTAEWFLCTFRRALVAAGVDSRQYGLHSLRREGARQAYQGGIPECGMAVEAIHQIPDWSSNAYQRYILPSTKSLKVALSGVVNPLWSTYPYY